MRRILIMGAGGRDFHNFNVAYRDDADVEVVAFTAAQIPGIANRVYPPALAGARYPDGIPIRAEPELEVILDEESVDEVVFAYSDVSHTHVMRRASIALARGADFTLLGPSATTLRASKPVVAVCAVRTGAGKSQTSRYLGRYLTDLGLRVAYVRHPMPYGDLEAMRVQRFATLEDIDASHPTIEEREEYEAPVRLGMVVYAGVDYGDVLRAAERDADVIIWDGGNNDFSFFEPDVCVCVTDPLRAGDELGYHPGEVNLRMADVVVVNKVDAADEASIDAVVHNARARNPSAPLVRTASPVTLAPGPSLAGRSVLVVEDGPTITHGGMSFGAGTVAARAAGASELVDPRPYAVGSIAHTFEQYPMIGAVVPAMGYGARQLDELAATIRAVPCDVVVTGTPVDLGRLVDVGHPIRRATYELTDAGTPTLVDVIGPHARGWLAAAERDEC